MAAFIVAFPGFRPHDYWALTKAEHDALVKAFNDAHRNQ